MIKIKIFSGGMVLLCLALMVLSYYHYKENTQQIYARIDQRLFDGATAAHYVVDDALHDLSDDQDNAVIAAESSRASHRLTQLCRDLRLHSLMTLIQLMTKFTTWPPVIVMRS